MTSRKTKLHQIHGIVGRHATLLNSDVTYPWKGSLEFSYLMHIFTNKIIKSHSLDERLLSCSDTVEVRQVRFHPGSPNESHILVLTSDNTLRLYHIYNEDAVKLGEYLVGEKPIGLFPGSKTPFLDMYGEIAVDFDFGQPEIINENPFLNETPSLSLHDSMLAIESSKSEISLNTNIKYDQNKQSELKWSKLLWPVYVLRGDCTVFTINVPLNTKQQKPILKGPLPLKSGSFDITQSEACSLICLNTSPMTICIALSTGVLCHCTLLDVEETTLSLMKQTSKTISNIPTKELIMFESIELELGLTITDEDFDKIYKYPIFLHKDESKLGRYFATHCTGVHSITISFVDDLENFVNGPDDVEPSSDLFTQPSTVEYLVCTKTASSENVNPVIGFSPYYEPTSIITVLNDGSVITLGILSAAILPKYDDLDDGQNDALNSPLKKMLKEPFDQYIQKILKKKTTQPVLKLNSSTALNQEQSYELFKRASQVFQGDYFKYHTHAREAIEKRIKALSLMKSTQLKEIERMNNEKKCLQEKAENLAIKYEDAKDKQNELLKKCENLLMLVARKRSAPSDAEKEFMKEVNDANERITKYADKIEKLKYKMKYQEIQMANWKQQEAKQIAINELKTNTIKGNLDDMNRKITQMIDEVNEYKKQLSLT